MSRKRYNREFKAEACKLATAEGYGPVKAARALGVPKQTLDNWLKSRNLQSVQQPLSQDPRVLTARLREAEARIKRLEAEKDILKKATVYFASQNL